MTRMVNCIKLGKEAEGLERPTLPGELGQRIFESVSKDAWQLWMKQQTLLINENRLSLIKPEDRAFLAKEMEDFFFHGGTATPEGYTPPTD